MACVQGKEHKVGEIPLPITDISTQSVDPYWYTILPHGTANTHKGALNITSSYSLSRFNAKVAHIDIDVVSAIDVAAHKVVITFTQVPGQPDLIFKTKKAKFDSKTQLYTWNQTFSCNLATDSSQTEVILSVFSKSKKLLGETRLHLSALMETKLVQKPPSEVEIIGRIHQAEKGGRRGLPMEWMEAEATASSSSPQTPKAEPSDARPPKREIKTGVQKQSDASLVMKEHSLKLYPMPSKSLGLLKLGLEHNKLVICPYHVYIPLFSVMSADPQSMLSLAASLPGSDHEKKTLLSSVIQVFTKQHLIVDSLLKLMDQEIESGGNLKSGPVNSMLLSYMRLFSRDLVKILTEPMTNLFKSWDSFREPTNHEGTTERAAIRQPLEKHLDEFSTAIFENSHRVPINIKRLFASIKKRIADPHNCFSIISHLMIKQFFCDVIRNPKEYNLEDAPDELRFDNAKVVVVILEYLSGEEKFPDTFYLACTNPWIAQTVPKLKSFIDQICALPIRVPFERVVFNTYEESMATIIACLLRKMPILKGSDNPIASQLFPLLEGFNTANQNHIKANLARTFSS